MYTMKQMYTWSFHIWSVDIWRVIDVQLLRLFISCDIKQICKKMYFSLFSSLFKKFIRGQESPHPITRVRLPHCRRQITRFLNSIQLILYKEWNFIRSFKVTQQWPHLQSKPYFSFNSFNLFSEFSSTEYVVVISIPSPISSVVWTK